MKRGIWQAWGTAILTAFVVVSPAAAQAQDLDMDADLNTEEIGNEWVASGAIGSTMGDDVDDASVNFGGGLSYLWNGIIGGEFLAGFTSNADLPELATESWLNTYMANVIAAAPIGGPDRLFQPYASGGIGAINLRPDIADGTLGNLADTQLGANVGGGLMAFGGNWGLRGDVRWYTGLENTNPTDPADALNPGDVLGDTSF